MCTSLETMDDGELYTHLLGLRGAYRTAIDEDAAESELARIAHSISDCEAEIKRRRHGR